MPIALYDLVIPGKGKRAGDLDELAEHRYTMVWLLGGRVHIRCGPWKVHRDKSSGVKLNIVESYELTEPPPARDCPTAVRRVLLV